MIRLAEEASAVDRAALEDLAAHALPEDAPGAWIKQAVAVMLGADDGGDAMSHTLTVFNAVDVPESVATEVMRLLEPFDADTYRRDCDESGRAL